MTFTFWEILSSVFFSFNPGLLFYEFSQRKYSKTWAFSYVKTEKTTLSFIGTVMDWVSCRYVLSLRKGKNDPESNSEISRTAIASTGTEHTAPEGKVVLLRFKVESPPQSQCALSLHTASGTRLPPMAKGMRPPMPVGRRQSRHLSGPQQAELWTRENHCWTLSVMY